MNYCGMIFIFVQKVYCGYLLEQPHWRLFLQVVTIFVQGKNKKNNVVKPVLSDHKKQDLFLAFQTGGCLLLNESSAESSYELLSFSNKQPPVNSGFHVT